MNVVHGYPKGSESVGYRGHIRYLHLIFARATPDQKTDPQQNCASLVFYTMTLLHSVVLLYSVVLFSDLCFVLYIALCFVLYNDLCFVLYDASPLVAT